MVHERRVALPPAPGVGRGDLRAPGAVVHVDVRLQHHLDPERLQLVDRLAHHVVVVAAVGARGDRARRLRVHVPGDEQAGPACPGRRERPTRVAARGVAVLVVPPGHVRDPVELEHGGRGRRGARDRRRRAGRPAAAGSQGGERRDGEPAAGPHQRPAVWARPVWARPVCVRHENGTHSVSPTETPPASDRPAGGARGLGRAALVAADEARHAQSGARRVDRLHDTAVAVALPGTHAHGVADRLAGPARAPRPQQLHERELARPLGHVEGRSPAAGAQVGCRAGVEQGAGDGEVPATGGLVQRGPAGAVRRVGRGTLAQERLHAHGLPGLGGHEQGRPARHVARAHVAPGPLGPRRDRLHERGPPQHAERPRPQLLAQGTLSALSMCRSPALAQAGGARHSIPGAP